MNVRRWSSEPGNGQYTMAASDWLLRSDLVLSLVSLSLPMPHVSQSYCRIMSKIDYDKPHLTKTSCLQLDD